MLHASLFFANLFIFTPSDFQLHLLVLHNAVWLLLSELQFSCTGAVSPDSHLFRIIVVVCHTTIFRIEIWAVKK